MKMKDLFGMYLRKFEPNGDYGIEIETETLREYEIPTFKYWRGGPDGSLRHFGIEYTSRGALDYKKDLDAALTEFGTFTSGVDFLDSVYSSLHVHVNTADFEVQKFPVFMALLYLMENVLVRYCGPDRDGNLFCLKTSQAEAGLDSLISIFEEFNSHDAKRICKKMAMVRSNVQKYSAINYAPLSNLGSVELRMHGGTTNVAEIKNWVDIIQCIKEASNDYKTPNQIIEHLHKVGAIGFVNNVFGKKAKALIVNKTEEDINDNLFYLIRIAKAADWLEFDPKSMSNTSSMLKKSAFIDLADDEGVPLADIAGNPTNSARWIGRGLRNYRANTNPTTATGTLYRQMYATQTGARDQRRTPVPTPPPHDDPRLGRWTVTEGTDTTEDDF